MDYGFNVASSLTMMTNDTDLHSPCVSAIVLHSQASSENSDTMHHDAQQRGQLRLLSCSSTLKFYSVIVALAQKARTIPLH